MTGPTRGEVTHLTSFLKLKILLCDCKKNDIKMGTKSQILPPPPPLAGVGGGSSSYHPTHQGVDGWAVCAGAPQTAAAAEAVKGRWE